MRLSGLFFLFGFLFFSTISSIAKVPFYRYETEKNIINQESGEIIREKTVTDDSFLEKNNPQKIGKFEKPPVIDGKIDEDEWQGATILKDFVQIFPGDNTDPSFPTEVYLAYDSKFLYMAFYARDYPSKIRATVGKRDDILDTDDSVRVLLDTFNDKRRAYVLIFNPLGVQQDGIRTEGSGVDFSVDIVMESKGSITKDGYIVEVAVPFKSLRYEAGKGKIWGTHLFRQIQHLNNESDSWMLISREQSSLPSQSGYITGLKDLAAGRTLELIPGITFDRTV